MPYEPVSMLAIGLVVFILGMSKGGFPISGISLPLLVLIWPEQGQAARSAVSFMLPLLCLMDIVGALMYRKNIAWHHIVKLMPATFAGVTVASLLFVAEDGIAFTDQVLKIVIGIIGLLFSGWYIMGRPKMPFSSNNKSRSFRPSIYGFFGGLSSTIAHAAGPVMQMYFLPTGLPKIVFAGTTVYFFLILNGIKLIPFFYYKRITNQQLLDSIWFLPIIPIGVIGGYTCVRLMQEKHYTRFIHFTLAATSLILILRAVVQ